MAEPDDLLTEVVDHVFALAGRFTEAGDEITAPEGLSAARWLVLGALQDGPLSPAEIARRRGLTRQSIRESVARLERSGHLARTAGADQRTFLVALTARGREALARIEPRRRTWAEERAAAVDVEEPAARGGGPGPAAGAVAFGPWPASSATRTGSRTCAPRQSPTSGTPRAGSPSRTGPGRLEWLRLRATSGTAAVVGGETRRGVGRLRPPDGDRGDRPACLRGVHPADPGLHRVVRRRGERRPRPARPGGRPRAWPTSATGRGSGSRGRRWRRTSRSRCSSAVSARRCGCGWRTRCSATTRGC
ncbi:MarR family transcriptional regulator [Nocardioides convexus]|uniref:MarR family winged helix-turn-helix transcriptional regulator n=1 Tax=Nocardioides convexus TaxID=2712224 RepID=UPI0024181DB6|nr:MarR family transcriptional regulator [Nocardioides convexus]